MEEINTKNGIYRYKKIKFENGIKEINREIAKENLLDLKKCLDSNNLQFGLIYGTLLGAIRENNFIKHDEDTDIFMLEEKKPRLLDILFELNKLGFEVGRYTGKLLSIIRNGEYIDIYFFRKIGKNKRGCEGYVIKSYFLENLQEYKFLGENFKIPNKAEKLLNNLYGTDWMIPKVNTPASNYGIYLKIKFFIRDNFKMLFKIISWLKKKLNV